MEKRVIVAFALSMIVLVIFSRLQTGPGPRQPSRQPETVLRDPASAPEPSVLGRSDPGAVPISAGPRKTVETDLYRAEFDPAGGRLVSFGLKSFTRKDEAWLESLPGDTFYPFETPDYPGVVFRSGQPDLKLNAGGREQGELVFTGQTADGLTITKRFGFDNARYGMTFELETAGVAAAPDAVRVAAFSQPVNRDRQQTEEIITSARGQSKRIRSGTLRGGDQSVYDADFLARRGQYLLAFMRPERPLTATLSADAAGNVSAFYLVDPAAGDNRFYFYAGPADHGILTREATGIAEALPAGPLVMISRVILKVLTFFYRVIPNWGVAIILLTLLFKAVFFPLTRISLRTMRTMQKIQPMLKELSAKYKSNPQAMQKEMFGIYRQFKVNPMGGCLPMLVQIPVFIAMFVMLRSAVVLRGAPFALWIDDLSLPDRLADIGNFPVNILPLLMGVTMFVQQKLSGAAAAGASAMQAQQQKMMLFMMPVMLTVFLYNLPSGLMLYWTTTNLVSIAENRIATRHIH